MHHFHITCYSLCVNSEIRFYAMLTIPNKAETAVQLNFCFFGSYRVNFLYNRHLCTLSVAIISLSLCLYISSHIPQVCSFLILIDVSIAKVNLNSPLSIVHERWY